jgi:hypothetical protein
LEGNGIDGLLVDENGALPFKVPLMVLRVGVTLVFMDPIEGQIEKYKPTTL